MWNNVRDAFPSELRSMYQSLRAEGLISYDEVERRFEEHQHTWPEAIFNEDAYFKYVKPFIDDGEDNLAMCLGSKEQQRKWWLYNRFRYIDSKYNSGNALSSYIQARVYHKSDLDVTPYADIYASAYFDSNLVQARAERNTVTTVESPEAWDPGGADAVLRIYSADQIKSLGDMSQFYVGDISFAAATKLQEVKLGDADANYNNEHLVNVGFGNNTLLSSIDIRNCPNLTQMVDVSGCTGLETVHLEGTNVAGIHLADASAIRELYLPASITNLTLKNQSKLETLEIADMSNIETLWVEGAMADDAIDWIDDIASSNRKLRIVGFDKTFESDDEFNNLWDNKIRTSMGLDDSGLNAQYAYLNGTFTVNELARGIYDALSNYPFLTINYTTLGDYMYKMYLENSNKFTSYSDNEITEFRSYAFYNSKITNINCPNVTVVRNNVFSQNTNATLGALTVIGSAGMGNINTSSANNLDLSHVTKIYADSFNNFRGNEIRLPALTQIVMNGGTYHSFFQVGNAGNVRLVDLPDGITYLSADETTDITGTTAAQPGNSFQSFVKCTAFIFRSTTMIEFFTISGQFQNSPLRQLGDYYTVGQGYVYVPASLVDTYKTTWANHSQLSGLEDYIRAIEDYPEICDPNYQGGE